MSSPSFPASPSAFALLSSTSAEQAHRIAELLQNKINRTALQEAIKQSNGKDLSAWASLIRYDTILACGIPSNGNNEETLKKIDRLAGQAYLANKDTVKLQPLPYISLTLDQARAQFRIKDVATAKKVLRGVASVPEVKNSWEFFKVLSIFEAIQGDAVAMRRVFDSCRERHGTHAEYQVMDQMMKQKDGIQLIAKLSIDNLYHPLLAGIIDTEGTGTPKSTSGDNNCNNNSSSNTTPFPPTVVPVPSADKVSTTTTTTNNTTVVSVPPPNPPPVLSARVSTIQSSSSRPRMSLLRSGFMSSLSPVAEGKRSTTTTMNPRTSLLPNANKSSSLLPAQHSHSMEEDMDMSGDDSTRTSNNTTIHTTTTTNNNTTTSNSSFGSQSLLLTTVSSSGTSTTTSTSSSGTSTTSVSSSSGSSHNSTTSMTHNNNNNTMTSFGSASHMNTTSTATNILPPSMMANVDMSASMLNTTTNGTVTLNTTNKKNSTNTGVSAKPTNTFIVPDYIRDFKFDNNNGTKSVPSSTGTGSTSNNKLVINTKNTGSGSGHPAATPTTDNDNNNNHQNNSPFNTTIEPLDSTIIFQPRNQRAPPTTSNTTTTTNNNSTASKGLSLPVPTNDNDNTVILQPRNQRAPVSTTTTVPASSSSTPKDDTVILQPRNGTKATTTSGTRATVQPPTDDDKQNTSDIEIDLPDILLPVNSSITVVGKTTSVPIEVPKPVIVPIASSSSSSLDESSFMEDDDDMSGVNEPVHHHQPSLPSYGTTKNNNHHIPSSSVSSSSSSSKPVPTPVAPSRSNPNNNNAASVRPVSSPTPSSRSTNSNPNHNTSTVPTLTGTIFDTLATNNEVVRVNHHNYLRLSCIGRGGSSRVYRVLGEDMNLYALKRVRLSRMDNASVDTYKNEINLLKRLADSRHIIKLIDAEISYETRCIHMVMECGQADLNSLVAQERERMQHAPPTKASSLLTMDENVLRLVWQQMLEAVQTIHEARIVHSDLKPANFVFVEGVLKLIDFGIAKAISNDTTNIVRDTQVGTINYMSPEAIMDVSQKGPGTGGRVPSSTGGKTVPLLKQGRASDIWSLGCILYQMTYGRTPFADLSLIQKLHAICDPNYQIHFPDCGNLALMDVLKLCLQRDPTKRPSIAGPNGLLDHPFLCPPQHTTMNTNSSNNNNSSSSSSTLPSNDSCVLSQTQLTTLFSHLVTNLLPSSVTNDENVMNKVQQLNNQLSNLVVASIGNQMNGGEVTTETYQTMTTMIKSFVNTPPFVFGNGGITSTTTANGTNKTNGNGNATSGKSIPASVPSVPMNPHANILASALTNSRAALKTVVTTTTNENSSASSSPSSVSPVPTTGTVGHGSGLPLGKQLQTAILQQAASLRPVDKENIPTNAKHSNVPPTNENGSLLSAMRKGLAERFDKVRASPTEDTTEMNITTSWTNMG